VSEVLESAAGKSGTSPQSSAAQDEVNTASVFDAEPAAEVTVAVPDIAAEKLPSRPSAARLAATLMSGALLSKLLGFVREVLMAQIIGTSVIADGFRGAITVVLIPLIFLQNESVPAILIPMHREAQREGRAPQFLTSLSIALGLAACVLMLAVEIFADWWVDTLLGGFAAERRRLTIEFVHIMGLAMPASTLLNCFAASEIAMGRTQLTNIRAALQNVSVIIGVFVIATTHWAGAIAWAFTFAFNALALWAIWSLWRMKMLSLAAARPRLVMQAGLEFLRRLRPLLALPLAEQAQIWVERILASRLLIGSVAALDYARTLTESALLLISQPVGLAVLSTHRPREARTQVDTIARPLLAVSLPASAFLVAFAPDIVHLVFMRGAFTQESAMLTSAALRGISFGLWAATLGWILLRVLNSAGRNVTAAFALVAAYAANIVVNLSISLIPAGDTHRLLFLGLGETARGIVLLTGIAISLKCGLHILRLSLLAAIPAAAVLFMSGPVHTMLAGTLLRLMVGGCVCIVGVILASVLLMPETWRIGLARLWQWSSGLTRRAD
jgi:putative peptidoglycan lipid II flippase